MSSIDKITPHFQLLYQKIMELYTENSNKIEKWNTISSHIHDNNKIFLKLFNVLRKQNNRKEISLDYKINQDQLSNQISTESDVLVKCSLMITSLHNIIYDLLTSEGNYFFSLDGKEEMHVLKKKITYYISLNIQQQQNIHFHAFILLYGLESLFNSNFYVGMDFEYTNKKIQLAQLNFEHSKVLQSIIMIVDPNELEPVIMDNFIKLIVCSKYIKKILHGSDSLDIPYLYNHMLKNDPDKIIRLTKTLIDTRFICEYYKINRDETDNRCSIYDEDPGRSAIYFFGLISKEQQDKLSDLLQSMPPVHDITWNIKKMPQSQVLYAQYDVIFIKWFYYRMIYVATKDDNTAAGKKSIMELYNHVLYELTQFIYLESNEITFLLAKCKEEVDPVNNYMVRKPGIILKLTDIYNQTTTNIITSTPKADIDKIIKVNYYKRRIQTLIKKMVYTIVSKKCKIYKDKNTVWTDKLDNQYVFDFFKKMQFNYLFSMFKEIENILQSRIGKICN